MEWLYDKLSLSPLERVCHVLTEHRVSTEAIVDSYDVFLTAMNDRRSLELLNQQTDSQLPNDHFEYQRLRENARTITDQLTQFLLNREDDWDCGFCQRLIF